MSAELWKGVDDYAESVLLPPDEILRAAQEASVRAGLPSISVSPLQGQLLHLLVRACGARNVLEIGTLGGYSTIWLARALPAGGRLITLEAAPLHADVARSNLARANLADAVEIRVGPALESLPKLAAEGRGPFDFIFIDADKPNTPEYFELALSLARQGTVIVVDNVVRDGTLADGSSDDSSVVGMRRLMERLSAEPRVSATVIQTVGSKGYDGFALAVVMDRH